MQVHLITTACLDSSMNGIAISNETISNPKHPVKNAFEDTSGWWEASQLPVSVSYRFGDDLYISPSHMYIGGDKKNEGRPIAFQVFGQSIEPVSNQTIYEDLIGTVDADSFLYGVKSERIDLYSHHIYNQIHTGGSQNSAFEQARQLICQNTSYANTISISCIPIYYLEPNTTIYVEDKESSIKGYYVINTISLPLTYNGNMTISASKAITIQ